MKLKRIVSFLTITVILVSTISSCEDNHINDLSPREDASSTVQGKVILKALPDTKGFMTLHETLQLQQNVTIPKREIVWLKDDFSERSRYTPADGWSLIDAVTHPSGQTSAVCVKVDVHQGLATMHIKILRFKTDGTNVEHELHPLSATEFPQQLVLRTLDRVRLSSYGEDLFVTARWAENQLQAYRLSFEANQFIEQWVRWVEPPTYLTATGIIGGGFDNFHQGDYDHFVYSDVDNQGNLYVAVPSAEEVLANHDTFFNENLMQNADPSIYEYGVAIVTKFAANGERLSSKLIGNSLRTNKHMLNMRVSDQGDIYLVGRIKLNSEPNGWDAWLLVAEPVTGTIQYERFINVKDGDMLWDIAPLLDNTLVAVGSTGYTQNPHGLSVSDSRNALAILLDGQGNLIREIDLPQGPAIRGSETMSVSLLGNRNILFSGAHNAPGTHGAVHADGFLAIRGF